MALRRTCLIAAAAVIVLLQVVSVVSAAGYNACGSAFRECEKPASAAPWNCFTAACKQMHYEDVKNACYAQYDACVRLRPNPTTGRVARKSTLTCTTACAERYVSSSSFCLLQTSDPSGCPENAQICEDQCTYWGSTVSSLPPLALNSAVSSDIEVGEYPWYYTCSMKFNACNDDHNAWVRANCGEGCDRPWPEGDCMTKYRKCVASVSVSAPTDVEPIVNRRTAERLAAKFSTQRV